MCGRWFLDRDLPRNLSTLGWLERRVADIGSEPHISCPDRSCPLVLAIVHAGERQKIQVLRRLAKAALEPHPKSRSPHVRRLYEQGARRASGICAGHV